MFLAACDNINELTETVNGYINFCVSTTIQTKHVKIFPNNKPWITPAIKTVINKKKEIFSKGNKSDLKQIQKELKSAIKSEKTNYKHKIENHFKENNMKRVWHGMKLMSGYSNGTNKMSSLPRSSNDYANELNVFYNRFDHHDFSTEILQMNKSMQLAPIQQPFTEVTEEEVRKAFSRLDPSKAAGPDGITPRILKNCACQLAYIYRHIFNWSFKSCLIPQIWKLSCIIPVPKKSPVSCNNDLRPIALTSVVMKTAERFVLNRLKLIMTSNMDPLQFAYRAKRSTEDAILYSLEIIYSHLERTNQGNSVRIMYFDFSSAFNTIQPHILIKKLNNMKVQQNLCLWILNYLTNRTQYVHLRASNSQSDTIISNTGAPQGTVLAPFLFTVYTSDIRSEDNSCTLVKFADDTALIGLIRSDNTSEYNNIIQTFVQYCDDNFLELNIVKTMEMIIDFRKFRVKPTAITIKNCAVQQVTSYKYLGVVIDEKLGWTEHIDLICKKLNTRLYCLRKMNKFSVSKEILTIFYTSVITSVWKYCLICWGGNSKIGDINRIKASIKCAKRLTGKDLPTFEITYNENVTIKLEKIIKDCSHPLYPIFTEAISDHSGRMILPYAHTNRHKSSYVPVAMKVYNVNHKR